MFLFTQKYYVQWILMNMLSLDRLRGRQVFYLFISILLNKSTRQTRAAPRHGTIWRWKLGFVVFASSWATRLIKLQVNTSSPSEASASNLAEIKHSSIALKFACPGLNNWGRKVQKCESKNYVHIFLLNLLIPTVRNPTDKIWSFMVRSR